MVTPDDTQRVQSSKASPAVPRSPAVPSERRARSLPPVLESEAVEATPPTPKRVGRMGLVMLVAGAGILAAVMYAYLFAPAFSTLSDPSPTKWSGEGP